MSELLHRNLERFLFFCPVDPAIITQAVDDTLTIIPNANGELNLRKSTPQGDQWYYSRESIKQECEAWFSSLNLLKIDVLYIYGVGLGHAYTVVKNWLKDSPNRHVIFLEDQESVIYRSLQTELGESLLNDSQVRLYYLNRSRLEPLLSLLGRALLSTNVQVSALPFYEQNKSAEFLELKTRADFYHEDAVIQANEYFRGGLPFIRNFYPNLSLLPTSKHGNNLFGKFKNVPAIICGAGPSLAKNFSLLKTLGDRALIFAGGTALNAVNIEGFVPHFSLGIDPHKFFYTRLIANQAFEVPFFYRNRMYFDAVRAIHGDRLFINGTGGHKISTWFEQQLGIKQGLFINEGYNVINFNLSIAVAMGCNPIIFVGVDLAYSNDESYAPGIALHAIHDPNESLITKNVHEELVVVNDINGKPVKTLWKWINESRWFTGFAGFHSETTFINATEGGIGAEKFTKMTLAEAAERYLTKQHDFLSRIHGEIQNSPMPDTVTIDAISRHIDEFKESFQRCQEFLTGFQDDLKAITQSLESSKETKKEIGEIFESEEPKSEPAFEHFLITFNLAFKQHQSFYFDLFENDPFNFTPDELLAIQYKNIGERALFLSKVIEVNLSCIEAYYKPLPIENRPASSVPKETTAIIKKLMESHQKDQGQYCYDHKTLTLIDPEFDLHYRENFVPQSHSLFNYPDGKPKLEEFYLAGVLHGPTTFYSECGAVLAKSWFLNGKREGKSWFYYLDGKIASLQRFKSGQREGDQEYYYPDTMIKSILPYKNNLLDGDVLLFHPNGRLKRKLRFSKGVRDGQECAWDENGLLRIEAFYLQGKPVGTAREWYANGSMSKELIYDDEHELKSQRHWTEQGFVYNLEDNSPDYFKHVSKESQKFGESVQLIADSLKNAMNALAQFPEYKIPGMQDFEKQLEKLKSIQTLMNEGLQNKGREQIWKTRSMQRSLEKEMKEQGISLVNDIINMQAQLLKHIENLKKTLNSKQNDEKKRKDE